MNVRYLFVMRRQDQQADRRQQQAGRVHHLGAPLLAIATSGKATLNVTMLYQPLTRPVRATASSMPRGVGARRADSAIDSATNCQ